MSSDSELRIKPPAPQMLSLGEAAEFLTMNISEIKEAISEGILPAKIYLEAESRWLFVNPGGVRRAVDTGKDQVEVTLVESLPAIGYGIGITTSFSAFRIELKDLKSFQVFPYKSDIFKPLNNDFTTILFDGNEFALTVDQAKVVVCLIRSKLENGIEWMTAKEIIRHTGVTGNDGRIDRIFAQNGNIPLYGSLILIDSQGRTHLFSINI